MLQSRHCLSWCNWYSRFLLMARYQKVCIPTPKSNEQYNTPSTRTVVVSSGNNKLMWQSTAEKQNNYGKKVRVQSIMRNHSQRYWERTAECVTIFGRDLTAMRPVVCWASAPWCCTCKAGWLIFGLTKVCDSFSQWWSLDLGNCQITIFGRDLTATRPVVVLAFCTLVLHLQGTMVDFWVDKVLW